MPANPSLSWQKLQDVYYNIRPCYESMSWQVDDIYTNFHWAISSNTTLIALASKSVPLINVINVYSISGVKLWSMVYNSTSADHIVDFCFFNESLCVVLSNGKVRFYSDFLGTFDEFWTVENVIPLSRSPDSNGWESVISDRNAQEQNHSHTKDSSRILDCQVWGKFLLLKYAARFTLTELEGFQTYEITLEYLDVSKINSLSLLSVTDSSLVALLSYDKTICRVSWTFSDNVFQFVDECLTEGPFSIISASPSGKLVALLNPNLDKIFVITQQLTKILLEYDTSNESSSPYMVKWAGNDAIVLSLKDEIKLIGPGQKSISFFYDIIDTDDLDFDHMVSRNGGDFAFNIPIIKTENDGLKIITKNKVEFLNRVPEASVHIFSVGSTNPSFILLDCVEKLAHQASKADSNISLLKTDGTLDIAIDGCLKAALEEFSPVWQKTILKAVSFGKIYESSRFDADRYLAVLNTLKILNQLRSPEIGLFLTNEELQAVGWPAVIHMLLRRSQHLLALQVVKLLDLRDCKASIFVDWCCRKIKKELNMSDLELFKLISKKLLSAQDFSGGEKKRNYISLSDISRVAFQEGRMSLCKLLIGLEPSTLQKASQLLQLGEVELALISCFQNCDYDLCSLILRYLKDTMSSANIFKILNQNELVGSLDGTSSKELSQDKDLKPLIKDNLFISGDLVGNFWKENIVQGDQRMLESYYKNSDKSVDLQLMRLKALDSRAVEATWSSETASPFEETYQHQKKLLMSMNNNRKFKSIARLELSLLELKFKLSNTFQQSFLAEKSVVDVVARLIKMHQLKSAAKVIKEFNISQEKFWNLVLNIYCKAQEFDRLNKFIHDFNANEHSTVKSPIGFEEIVETCMVYNCPKHLISTFISHCTDKSYGQRAELYIRNGDMISAAEEAYRYKDGDMLRDMQTKLAPEDANVLDAIKTYLNRLGF